MIHYFFTFADDSRWDLEIDETGTTPAPSPPSPVPAWMKLETQRCDACTLDKRHSLCPAAQAIAPVVETFGARISYEDLDLRVKLRGLDMRAKTQAQEAMRSIVGLLLPLSDCPVMRRLRPMARFHEPLASPEQTVFRVFGMYLVEQFLRSRQGQAADWTLDELMDLYRDVHEVNVKLAQRLRLVSAADANVNGVTLLDVLAHAVDFGFDNSENQLRMLFGMPEIQPSPND